MQPKLVCNMLKTESGSLRQPVIKGLREDKLPKECEEELQSIRNRRAMVRSLTVNWWNRRTLSYREGGAPLKTPLLGFGRIFCRGMRFEKSAILQVFRTFQNFCWNKISRPKHQKVVFRGCYRLIFAGMLSCWKNRSRCWFC